MNEPPLRKASSVGELCADGPFGDCSSRSDGQLDHPEVGAMLMGSKHVQHGSAKGEGLRRQAQVG